LRGLQNFVIFSIPASDVFVLKAGSTRTGGSEPARQFMTANRISDFRSDTVTKPTPAMRQAMADAEVGDDMYGEDPTVNALQEEAARIFGREAALFVPSGTMANAIAIKLLTRPGEGVIVESTGHSFLFEGGGMGLISGVQPDTIEGDRGIMEIARIEGAIQGGEDIHHARTSLILLENTHNMGGGTVLSLDYVKEVSLLARKRGLALHLDGARIFNAAVAAGRAVREWAALVDTTSFCLSKGLGAPVGSLLVGDREAIDNCLRIRKPLGGAMRQAGVLAAAGLIALRQGPAALEVDHVRASALSRELADLPGMILDPAHVETNIIMLRTARPLAGDVSEGLKEEGVLIHALGEDCLRFVTHRDLGDDDVDRAVTAMQKVTARLF